MKSDEKSMRAYILFLLLLSFLIPAAGCSTDDGLGGLSPACMVFDAEDVAGDGVVVTDWLSDCDVVLLSFYYRPAVTVDNVWSVEFEIHFPLELVIPGTVVGTTIEVEGEDDPLPSIFGTEVQAIGQLVAPGIVEFAITKVGDTDGVEAAGGMDNFLGTFAFGRIVSSGSGAATLVDGAMRTKTAGNPPVVIDGVTFHGGQFEIDN